MVETKKSNVWMWVLIGLFALIALATVYQAWSFATYRMSAQIDCSSNQIDYVTLTGDDAAKGECAFPLVDGATMICALPKDIHCKGLVQDFPLVRAIVEAAK
jgi:hypothetical protein